MFIYGCGQVPPKIPSAQCLFFCLLLVIRQDLIHRENMCVVVTQIIVSKQCVSSFDTEYTCQIIDSYAIITRACAIIHVVSYAILMHIGMLIKFVFCA